MTLSLRNLTTVKTHVIGANTNFPGFRVYGCLRTTYYYYFFFLQKKTCQQVAISGANVYFSPQRCCREAMEAYNFWSGDNLISRT